MYLLISQLIYHYGFESSSSGLIYQVGGQNTVDNAVFISLVKFLHTVCEQTEGGADRRFCLLCAAFNSACNFKYMLSPEEIISSMMITSLPSTLVPRNSWATIGLRPLTISGVVTSLIEHTHIQTKYVCKVNSTSHTAFIRADNHHVVGIDLQVGLRCAAGL